MLLGFLARRTAASPLGVVVDSCRSAVTTLGLTSGLINVLTLTGSIFMMQVYDRVLASQSIPTLVGLSVIAVVAYVFQGWLEAVRSRVLTLIGEKIDADLSPKLHAVGMRLSTASPSGVQDSAQAFRDLEAIRVFVTGQGLVAALDIPWVLLYVAVATLLHPLFGLTTALAGLLLVWLTYRTEVSSKVSVKEVHEANMRKTTLLDANVRGAESILANGMGGNRTRLWAQAQEQFLSAQRRSTFVIGGYSAAAKTVRTVLQSFVLGLGAYLAIRGQITAGAIIAGSIVVARALAPIDQAIASWRPFVAARDGHERLAKLLTRAPDVRVPFALPRPSRAFAVRDVTVVPPGAQVPTLGGVSFNLVAGQVLGIVGPSGSGKTTLVKTIVGAWKPARGTVAFDDAGPDQWTEEALGRAIGYLPQDVQLFDGTIAANIARFDHDPSDQDVQAAAIAASLDTHIRARYAKTGYDTPIGANGSLLAGGMRQRLGLARALYGEPFVLVLDEPNSNLDEEGSEALRKAVRSAKARGAIVILVTHKEDILDEVDLVLTMLNGTAEFFGPRRETLKRWHEKHHPTRRPVVVPAVVPAVVNGASIGPGAQRSDTVVAAKEDVRRPQPSPQSWSTPSLRLTGVPKRGA